MEIKEILNQHWIDTAIAILVAIGVAYYFKPRPRLAAQANTLKLVGPDSALPNDIEFLFKGKKVPNVTLSRIAVWNIGNRTIKGDQIVKADPLRIVTSDRSSILEATIHARTREINDVSCVQRQGISNEVECRFDYLDPSDGAVIQLVHTGNDKLKVEGTLRGVPKVRVFGTGRPRQQGIPLEGSQLTPFGAKMGGLLCLLLSIAVTIYSTLHPESYTLTDEPRTLGLLLVFIGGVFLWISRWLPPYPLSTEITSSKPTRPFWHRWTKKKSVPAG